MTEAPLVLDLERQKQAKAYARLSRRLMLVDLIFGGVYALGWLVFGWSATLVSALESVIASYWLLILAYMAVFGGIYYLLNLPLSFYEGYVLPHRYQLSNQTLPGWFGDQVKGLVLGAVLGGIVLEVIYAILRSYPESWWLWVAGFLLLFNVLLETLAPVILFPIFNKFIPLGKEHADLVERLLRLTERAKSIEIIDSFFGLCVVKISLNLVTFT